MNETSIVIVGNVATDPVARRVGEQSVLGFRVASNSRRRTADGGWEQGKTLYASVSCWGRLAEGTVASLRKGDPVIVAGQIYTSEYDDRDGNPRNSVEVRASAVGPDLARCIARVDKIQRRPDEQVVEAGDQAPIGVTGIDGMESTEDDLPLTA
jgi:single-strand DNA-binding protein